MWEIHSNLQLWGFAYSLILGMIFAAFYDVFRSIRVLIKHSDISVFLEDIIFFVIISLITFIFLIGITNGEIRGYILFGIVLGYVIFYKLVSKYFLLFLKLVIGWILKVFLGIIKGFYWFFDKIDVIFREISKNTLKNLKKCLKTTIGLLYTNKK